MDDFSFISDDLLKEMINRDMKELRSCLANNLPKSTMVLAGSIIEAILVDYFLAFPPTNSITPYQIIKEDLFSLINLAFEESVISEDAKNISTVIRGFRNLIHPGVEVRKQSVVDMPRATTAVNLVDIIIQDIYKKYIDMRGLTAELAIIKLDKEILTVSVFEHFLKSMSNIEKIKLYKALPLLDYKNNEFSIPLSFQNTKILKILHLYRLLSNFISNEIKEQEAIKLYNNVTTQGREDIVIGFCFYGPGIKLIESIKKETLIEYYLNMISTNTDEEELQLINDSNFSQSLAECFNNPDSAKRLTSIILNRGHDTDNNNTSSKIVLDIMNNLVFSLDENIKELIIPEVYKYKNEILADWLNYFENSFL